MRANGEEPSGPKGNKKKTKEKNAARPGGGGLVILLTDISIFKNIWVKAKQMKSLIWKYV